ncbi:xanthine phosphoribosyltransferase [Peptoniphilus lacrimalis]|uniref:xanthine phosphoribosyltransferase n=1 Tax=Peptoniphilus lacrimalis TaxID=33031 RepID=UPI002550B1D4|nr:xanthine phosphoribosyltransferase [Peptoniphilus lacrimalis]MDK7722263.1 xanthine phosphoribosyltransferase [Peptoniphilus lacrimalis]MDK7731865.1 xanthine phosphoribosyltransferase [Peptoniphilus lacrimalis]
MKLLEDRIIKDGKILEGDIIKVDSFLNHQLDIKFLNTLAEDVAKYFKNKNINKILTIEASGIAFATVISENMNYIPVVFSKKKKTLNIGDSLWQSHVKSYTTKKDYMISVSKEFIGKDDNLLIVDDFLAEGNALRGLIDISKKAGANIEGISVAVEKGYQGGGDYVRKLGYDLYSLAIIDSIENGKFSFKRV